MKFWAMLGSFIFGAVGYYMLIFISGIEKIPADLYEAATIDGASKIQQAFKITFPLLKGVTKTNLTFRQEEAVPRIRVQPPLSALSLP